MDLTGKARSSVRNILVKNASQTFKGKLADGAVAHFSFLLAGLPFYNRFVRHHPNLLEYSAILGALRESCSSVVSTDYRYDRKPIRSDVQFGLGRSISKSPTQLEKIRILYATGGAWEHQYYAATTEIERLSGQFDEPLHDNFRFPDSGAQNSEQEADLIYVVGNHVTAATYKNSPGKLRLLPGIASFPNVRDQRNRLTLHSSRSLLWIGAEGILHKGLHIAAQVAKRLGINLIALGISKRELPRAKRILGLIGCQAEIHPFLDPTTLEFAEIMARSSVVLGCSVSEGMSTSLLTAAAFGVMPISNSSCGCDIGIVVDSEFGDTLVEALCGECDKYLALSDATKSVMLRAIKEQVELSNSAKVFSEKITAYISNDIKGIFVD